MVRVVLFSLVCLLAPVATEGRAASYLPDFEKLVTAAGKGREAIAFLEKLPLEQRQDSDYQWALARAAQAADLPGPAAEAVATFDVLPKKSPRDLEPVRQWLAKRGGDLFDRALQAQSRGDLKTAVKSYLVSAKCDPAVLAKDDKGLRPAARRALDDLVAKQPERWDLKFSRAYYSYLFGDLEAAAAGVAGYLAAEKDPYRLWRAKAWAGRFERELASVRAADRAADRAAARRAARPPPRGRDPSASDAGASDRAARQRAETAARRRELEEQLKGIDAAIQDLANLKQGKVKTKEGQLFLVSHNQRQVAEKTAQLEAEKNRIQAELDGLR